MKNFLLALLILPFSGIAQTIQIDSFYGIRFGASKDEAFGIVRNLGGVVSAVDEIEELAYLVNLDFAGVKSKVAYLKFVDNKFYEGIIEFDVNAGNFRFLYEKLKLALSKGYGYGKDYSWIDMPYYWGDGNEFRALLEKKGKFCHVWSRGKQVTSDDFVLLEIGSDKHLRLVFQNHQFATMAAKKFRQFEASNVANNR